MNLFIPGIKATRIYAAKIRLSACVGKIVVTVSPGAYFN